MNIGIVTTWEERGAAYVSRQYYDALASKHNVTIFARGGLGKPSVSPLFDEALCHRSTAPTRIYSTFLRKRELLRWIKRHSLDVVFFNEQNWWPPVLWCKEAGLHVGSYIDYYTEATIPLFDIYDFLICNTKRHFSAFSWHPGAYYVPWGTDVEVFRPCEKGSKNDVTFFHSCGTSPARKGTDLVIDASRRLPSKKAKLIIHSQIDLRQFISTTLNTDKDTLGDIEFIEETVTAPGLYHLGDVYVYPSRLDGLGLTIAEALSCGLPTIVPDDGPMNEFIAAGRGKMTEIQRRYARSDGYYWPMNLTNVDALRRNMLYYIDDPEAVERESTNAREYALAELDWRKRHATVLEIFERSLDNCVRVNNAAANLIVSKEASLSSRAKRACMEVEYYHQKLVQGFR